MRIRILFLVLSVTLPIVAQQSTFEAFKEKQNAQFNQFKTDKQAEFDAFRKRVNEEYADFMRQAWEAFSMCEVDNGLCH